uniref:Putative secreted protein n=1 Tax=Anopheles marajoara TaxID=58244 RepID=A0A2M4CCS4_9DIPT
MYGVFCVDWATLVCCTLGGAGTFGRSLAELLPPLFTEIGVEEYVLPKWKNAKLSGIVSASSSSSGEDGVVYFLLL